eukprot:CAMPEP_0115314160 /NCGR_PEP_ID=MMETSP0270-20121206/76879_1 /TAXON_ID=71861 /ORGANISM="Scrippsiella trochoidea, Strain CCMP3099" /LENGTH=216 /DNA_ID=CAMNT_0002733357 /DNA_START=344 /DNA_END=993 /DNA_ORIENTATION=-
MTAPKDCHDLRRHGLLQVAAAMGGGGRQLTRAAGASGFADLRIGMQNCRGQRNLKPVIPQARGGALHFQAARKQQIRRMAKSAAQGSAAGARARHPCRDCFLQLQELGASQGRVGLAGGAPSNPARALRMQALCARLLPEPARELHPRATAHDGGLKADHPRPPRARLPEGHSSVVRHPEARRLYDATALGLGGSSGSGARLNTAASKSSIRGRRA